MASWCLAHTAETQDEHARATLNLEYNLRTSYTEEDGFGLIVDDGKVKLGAIAVATLAILEHEDRGELAGVREALLRTVEHLANVDGSFRTLYRPPERTDTRTSTPARRSSCGRRSTSATRGRSSSSGS